VRCIPNDFPKKSEFFSWFKKNKICETLNNPTYNRSLHFQNILVDMPPFGPPIYIYIYIELIQLWAKVMVYKCGIGNTLRNTLGTWGTCWKSIKNMMWIHWELDMNTYDSQLSHPTLCIDWASTQLASTQSRTHPPPFPPKLTCKNRYTTTWETL